MQYTDQDIFRQIGNLSEDLYFVFNIDKKQFDYLSPAFEPVWEMPSGVAINDPENLIKKIHPEDFSYVKTRLDMIKRSRKEGRLEFRILKSDGSHKAIGLQLFPLYEKKALKSFAGIIQDLTVLRNNLFYAEKINARKNSTLEILAHDLKGPLGIVSMMASSIRSDAKTHSYENILKSAEVIQQLCQRNIELVRNLVNREFLEAKDVELRKKRVDLVWAVGDLVDNYKKGADVLVRTFLFSYSHEKIFIMMDSMKLMQVFNNLISNAIKFTYDHGVIEIDVKDLGDVVQVTVRDNGVGIPEALQPFLFDKFTRARRPGLRGEEPVGLGMSIIKAIVELHSGNIRFESRENEGSSFIIEVPKL